MKVLDNLPEEDEELTPEDVRIPGLVNQLPFLRAGYWEKVHVASLVPLERREISPTLNSRRGGYMSGMGMAGGMPGMSGPPGMGMGMGSADMPGMGMGMGMSGGMGMGMCTGMGMPGMDVSENLNFPKTEAETIMVRALDFTVEQDMTYRFRLRVVVPEPEPGP